MHEVLVNLLGGLSLPRKSVVRLTDRPDMTLDVYRGRKTTIQQYNKSKTNKTNVFNFPKILRPKYPLIDPSPLKKVKIDVNTNSL